MDLLSKKQILEANDISFEIVDVPQWGGKIRLKTLTALEYDKYQQGLFDERGDNKKINMINARSRMLSVSIIDENGNRIFDESDIDSLSSKSSAVIELLHRTALRLNGEDVSQEVLEKNFKTTTSSDSILS